MERGFKNVRENKLRENGLKMKKLHLICNAHLDPIWQWNWEEGAAAALSTFRSAANLCDEFDYIFCHNEVTLYQYIEEYDPELFEKIKVLVKQGKWKIMGGWFLQPDCNMPSGESIVRQIQTGKEYFKEKFGVWSDTAISFDAFGHNRGLVQIIKKCGQDSYISVRPYAHELELETNLFIWQGYDDSEIKVFRADAYNSPLGDAVGALKTKMEMQKDSEIGLALWGVGNHGGGPSRKDLADIEAFMEESDVEIMHSTPERFFADVAPTYIYDQSMLISMPGCYTSMSSLKRKHVEVENELFLTEKICSIASIDKGSVYPEDTIKQAVEDLLNSQFHDVLPGTTVRDGEKNGVMLLNHALYILNKAKAKAFFDLISDEKQAGEGEYPIFVFNPHPYAWNTVVEAEFSLADQNWTDTETVVDVCCDGRKISSQIIKEESNINLDWRKRIAFACELKPMAITRFDVKASLIPKQKKIYESKDIVYSDETKYVKIDGNTGLLTSYQLHGKEYVDGKLLEPYIYEDNADPWGMGAFQLEKMGANGKPFKLMEQATGIFENMKSVQIVEDGDIYLKVEAFFEKEQSKIRVAYKIYKNSPDIDVDVDVFWGNVDRILKLNFYPTMKGQYIGQGMFGTENLFQDGRECVSQRFVAVKEPDNTCFAIINNGTYGSSYKDNVVSLSLLRGAGYCVHPILERQLVPEGRFIKRIDQGEHNYSFKITVCQVNDLERLATEFNQKPVAVNAFPDGKGENSQGFVEVSNSNVVLTAMKKSQQTAGYVLRFVNNSAELAINTIRILETSITLEFGKYEVKTLIYNDGELKEAEEMLI